MEVTNKSKQIAFATIQEFVLKKLSHLNSDLTYHNIDHTIDVTKQCERIALEEGLQDEYQLYLLKVAALYHDTGFLQTYRQHEEKSCEIFLEDADRFHFGKWEKDLITSLIMATKLPQTPETLLEKVICDADLDYLGRPDFFVIGDGLRREFLKYGIISSNEEWDRLQNNFLSKHRYHTASCRRLREEAKQQNMAKLL